MGERQDASASDERNPSSPVAMSGIDWSIFKDGEEDTFGWLLRNNASASVAAMGAGMMGAVAGAMAADILPLDDIEMDRMMAGTSALASQLAAKSQSMASDTVVVSAPEINSAHSNARLLAAQLYEGLRSSPSKPRASLLSMLPNMPSFDNSLSESCDSLNEDSSTREAQEEKNDQEISTAKSAIGAKTNGTKNQGSSTASLSAFEEKAPVSSGNGRGKAKAGTSSSTKNQHPLKRKKSGPSSPTTATGSRTEEDLEKKQQRRVKNLVSVREFRKRKMKQLEQNEARLRRLEAENMDLKMRLKIGKEAILSEQREKQQIKEQMREMLQRNANEHEIAQFLNMYKVTYSDYGPKRREKLHFHLSRIRELLLPTQVTKLSLYSVEQGVDMLKRDHVIKEDPMSAPESATATMSLWGILADELEVSDEQQRQILERRAAIKKVRDDLNHTLSIVKKLEGVTDEKNTALEAQVAQLQQILTPSQATKFIIWVKENPAFMYMLDKLVDSTLQNTNNTEE
ncbi:unnamed protein product [Phytophthora fragariaefolia]|uniref:Unnamed protein product n=1 Tax=Phytophthora fragariaefolia TaxID=1490495 RepID=A0A9W6X1W2_9STRA|nr:unnamed protein product [Phytophthora fragariaefolia]